MTRKSNQNRKTDPKFSQSQLQDFTVGFALTQSNADPADWEDLFPEPLSQRVKTVRRTFRPSEWD